tara:strand:+ start:771 stop:1436 length:666 start_codon:yes stop_codon:yes gene_type:complete
MIIAIDGGAGTGKTTIAKLLSEKINFIHLNSGLIYRAVTYILLKNNYLNNTDNFYQDFLKDVNLKIVGKKLDVVMYDSKNITDNLYNKEITDNIKYTSNNFYIRSHVTDIQRLLSVEKNVICEGRDIGSVVFPNAKFKFFLDCDINQRTERRYNQFLKNNIIIDKNNLKKMILERDLNDSNREHSPLKRVSDAILIDTTKMNIEEVILKMYNNIKGKYVNK